MSENKKGLLRRIKDYASELFTLPDILYVEVEVCRTRKVYDAYDLSYSDDSLIPLLYHSKLFPRRLKQTCLQVEE